MPIVGTSSLENQVGPSVADARWSSGAETPLESSLGVNGCVSLKRERSIKRLEDARAEKQVKVEGSGGFTGSFVNCNGLDSSLLHRGAQDCQGPNPSSEVPIERLDLTPLVQGTGTSVSAPKDADLTDLLHDLDDAGDSDLDEEEFEDDSHIWSEALCDEWLGIGSISGNRVLAQMPEAEIIAKALDVSAELMHKGGVMGSMVEAQTPQAKTRTEALSSSSEQDQNNGDVGSRVQAYPLQPETITKPPGVWTEQAQVDGEIGCVVHADSLQPKTVTEVLGSSTEEPQRNDEIEIVVSDGMGKQSPAPVIVLLDSDSEDDDDDFMMFDHPVETSEPKTAVNVELAARRLAESTSQLKDAVKVEPEILRQPERSSELGNAIKVEPEILRQPEKSSQLGNAIKVEPEILRQPENNCEAVKVEPGNIREPEQSPELSPIETPEFVPNETSGFEPRESSLVASVANSELENMTQVVVSSGSHGFDAPTTQTVACVGRDLRGFLPGTVEQHRKLMWSLVSQNPDLTLGAPYSALRMDPAPPQANRLPSGLPRGLPYGLPYGLGCSPGFTSRNLRESFYSGEHVGPRYGWLPPTISANVPSDSGPTQASIVGNGNHAIGGEAVVSVPRPSLPAGNFRNAAASADRAGPSQSWSTPDSSAVVKVTASSSDQAGPSHRWSAPGSAAVVPYRYDTTLSTTRVEVTRALQQYLICINKAKDDRAKAVAERESTSNEPVKEGNRRGLDCRPDIVAYNEIKKMNAGVNPGVNVGDLPGVMIGDTFTYRHQMAIVGLHRLPNVGIDYGHPPPDHVPTATAIVMMPKAGYVDDEDKGDQICYTGQGGRRKRNQQAPFVCDQILTKGNLALAKNHERNLPVRVIRGHFGVGDNGPGFLGYSYDGLYYIVSYELADGINGFKVYKFYMMRLQGQPRIPPCIRGCKAHESWNSARRREEAEAEVVDIAPLQAKDPTLDVKPICMQGPPEDVKPICIQAPPEDVKPILPQGPPVEMRRICM